MKTHLTYKVLEIIKDGVLGTSDVIIAFLEAGYGASGRQMRRKLSEVRKRREDFTEFLEERQKFYNLLSRLKKDGFISKSDSKWFITRKGKDKLIKAQSTYSSEEDKTFKIVAFDIPETKSADRRWLRKALRDLGFKFLQKSLWIGKVIIPMRFIDELQEHKIINNVQIFEITKKGTLAELN